MVEYGVEDRIYVNEEYSEKDVKMTGVIGNARSLLAKRTTPLFYDANHHGWLFRKFSCRYRVVVRRLYENGYRWT